MIGDGFTRENDSNYPLEIAEIGSFIALYQRSVQILLKNVKIYTMKLLKFKAHFDKLLLLLILIVLLALVLLLLLRGGSSPKILGALPPSVLSSPSSFSPFSETEKNKLHIGLRMKSIISRVANSVIV